MRDRSGVCTVKELTKADVQRQEKGRNDDREKLKSIAESYQRRASSRWRGISIVTSLGKLKCEGRGEEKGKNLGKTMTCVSLCRQRKERNRRRLNLKKLKQEGAKDGAVCEETGKSILISLIIKKSRRT